MIKVTKLDNSTILINVELIQSLQATPDTVITFTTREKMMVKEPVEEISRRILEYQRSIHGGIPHIVSRDLPANKIYNTDSIINAG